jgi:hypothetical protein
LIQVHLHKQPMHALLFAKSPLTGVLAAAEH